MTGYDPRDPVPSTRADDPDPHGQAALLLVESLIHSLIARSLLTVVDAIDVVTSAIDARIEIAADRGDVDNARDRAIGLLSLIRETLAADEA